MNTVEPPRCAECGNELPPGLPPALCPVCALKGATEGLDGPGRATPEGAVHPARLGDHIGRYKLLQQIGEGGCGVVFMAEQAEPIRRKVALKIIKLGMDTKSVIARFEAERQALALMDHPNIAKVFDAGATETGRPYFVMELVRGVRITDYCDQHNLTTRARLDLFTQVCQAIQHAHQKGIIHRDIKPSNILVTLHDGVPVPKVIDFGIAKATSDQRLTDKTLFTAFEQFMGTPAYMSPEQAEMSGLDIDTRSDIYALGVLLYELLTGKPPFDGRELLAVGIDNMRRTIREKEPTRPSVRLDTMLKADRTEIARHRQTEPNKLTTLLRGDLDWIVMKALEKDRAHRYETANDLAADVARHLQNEPITARSPGSFYRLQKVVRRNKLAFAAVAAITITLLLGSVISTWQAVRASRAEREQNRLRVIAESAKTVAQSEAHRAEIASAETKMILSASDFLQSIRCIEEERSNDALSYLNRSLSGNPSNAAALTRLASLLTYRTWVLPRLTLKHNARVNSAQFSPDGKRIVTASMDKTARVWDVQTGRAVTVPMLHDSEIELALFSPDGQRIVTASGDNTARVWDAQTGQPVTEPMQHAGVVFSAIFSPDGKRVVTASYDKTARVWDAQTGVPITEPLRHAKTVNSAQFSPDGKRVVTASIDETARVWDAQTGEPLTPPMKHDFSVNTARFSPNGLAIVTASQDRTARLWDAQTGLPLTAPLKHGGGVGSAQFSPDGKWVLTASADKTVRVWDAETGEPVGHSMNHDHMVFSAQFSPDGQRIITASPDKTVRIWDARRSQVLTEHIVHNDPVQAAQFSPDGKQIVTVTDGNEAWVWNADTHQAVGEKMKHGGSVWFAEFSPDGKKILTHAENDIARMWDVQTGQPILGFDVELRPTGFSPDGRRIIGVGNLSSNTASIWDARTGQLLIKFPAHSDRIVTAEFSPDGKRVVTASWDGTARVWNARTGLPVSAPMEHTDWLFGADFSPDGMRILTASKDKTSRLWDANTGEALCEPMRHDDPVRAMQFSPDGKKLVTATSTTMRLWDAQTGQPLTKTIKILGGIYRLQFSSDGKRVLIASHRWFARVWDAQTGVPLSQPMKHDGNVFTAKFSPDGKRVVTTSEDKTARVWDTATGHPLTEPMLHGERVWSAQFTPDGRGILTASWDRTVRLLDVAPTQTRCPDWLLQLAEAVSGTVLNNQGLLEETKMDRVETLNQIRQRLNQEPGDDDWVVWGRWFLADPSTRTISPFSKIRVPTKGGQ